MVDGSIVKIGDGVGWTISSADDRLIILQTQNRLPNTVGTPLKELNMTRKTWVIEVQSGVITGQIFGKMTFFQ